MKLSESLEGIGRTVAYYPRLAECLGSIPAAILLAQFLYWRDKQRNEYLYKTAAEIQEETGLSPKTQRTARALLKRLGILMDKYARLKHETHFIIDVKKMDELFSKFLKKKEGEHVTDGHMAKVPTGTWRNDDKAYGETTDGHIVITRDFPQTSHRIPSETTLYPRPPSKGVHDLGKIMPVNKTEKTDEKEAERREELRKQAAWIQEHGTDEGYQKQVAL